MTANKKSIYRVVRKLDEEFFHNMLKTKSTTGGVVAEAQRDTFGNYFIVVDDENECVEVLRGNL